MSLSLSRRMECRMSLVRLVRSPFPTRAALLTSPQESQEYLIFNWKILLSLTSTKQMSSSSSSSKYYGSISVQMTLPGLWNLVPHLCLSATTTLGHSTGCLRVLDGQIIFPKILYLAHFTILFPEHVPHTSVPKLGSFSWGIPELVRRPLSS